MARKDGETKRRIESPEDAGSITAIMYNAAAGAQKGIQVMPVPERILGAGSHKIGFGRLVMIEAAGYTLVDSRGLNPSIVVPASMAPANSVVSTGLKHDTITVTGANTFLVYDDSRAIEPKKPS